MHILQLYMFRKESVMDEREQIREEMKKQLANYKEKMLDNAKDQELTMKLMDEFTQINLLLVSFEFTQKIVDDPEFLKEVIAEIDKEKK